MATCCYGCAVDATESVIIDVPEQFVLSITQAVLVVPDGKADANQACTVWVKTSGVEDDDIKYPICVLRPKVSENAQFSLLLSDVTPAEISLTGGPKGTKVHLSGFHQRAPYDVDGDGDDDDENAMLFGGSDMDSEEEREFAKSQMAAMGGDDDDDDDDETDEETGDAELKFKLFNAPIDDDDDDDDEEEDDEEEEQAPKPVVASKGGAKAPAKLSDQSCANFINHNKSHMNPPDGFEALMAQVQGLRKVQIAHTAALEKASAEKDQKINSLTAHTAALERASADKDQTINSLKAHTAALKQASAEKDQVINGLQAQTAAHNLTLAEKNHSIKECGQEIANLVGAHETALAAKDQTIGSLKACRSRLQAAVDSRDSELNRVTAERDQRATELSTRTASLDAAISQKQQLQKDLDNANGATAAAIEECRAAATKLEASRAALEAHHATLEQRATELEAENTSLRAQKAALEAGKATLEADNAALEADKATLEADKATLVERLASTVPVSEVEADFAIVSSIFKQLPAAARVCNKWAPMDAVARAGQELAAPPPLPLPLPRGTRAAPHRVSLEHSTDVSDDGAPSDSADEPQSPPKRCHAAVEGASGGSDGDTASGAGAAAAAACGASGTAPPPPKKRRASAEALTGDAAEPVDIAACAAEAKAITPEEKREAVRGIIAACAAEAREILPDKTQQVVRGIITVICVMSKQAGCKTRIRHSALKLAAVATQEDWGKKRVSELFNKSSTYSIGRTNTKGHKAPGHAALTEIAATGVDREFELTWQWLAAYGLLDLALERGVVDAPIEPQSTTDET
ncbi:hypothetical protein JKP88DRAFT_265816 [Tribonema minus]|uniref:Nucleoplasmin-like domain-containing protein n=1 Tax=Tribonema minus TaxID=303371 RepID=A0A835YIX7_9STRA|nr:hypothetical protein JKP88DRAFT_265816 [Tribonema minus]